MLRLWNETSIKMRPMKCLSWHKDVCVERNYSFGTTGIYLSILILKINIGKIMLNV